MKKIAIITVCLLTFLTYSSAQSAISAAKQLSDYLSEQHFDNTVAQFDLAQDSVFLVSASQILIDFTDDPDDIEDAADLNDAYDGNPFIGADNGVSKILLPNIFQSSSIMRLTGGAGTSIDDGTTEGTSGGGGSLVSNVADGLAKFLVKRTKEELTITFFQKFKDKITNDPYLQGLFPQTADLLGLIDNEIYQFNAYIETLREHFIKDMKSLPINLRSFLNTSDLLIPSEQIIADDMLELAQMLLDDATPLDLIRYMGQHSSLLSQSLIQQLTPALQTEYTDAGTGFKLLNLLSESLISSDNPQKWIKPDELRDILRDKKTLYLYLGLLWQKGEGIQFSDGKSLRTVLNKVATTAKLLEDVKKELTLFSDYAHDVQISLDSIRAKKQREQLVYDDYYLFFHSTFSLLESGVRFEKQFFSHSEKALSIEQKILSTLSHFNELNFNIKQRHYTSAVTDVVFIFDQLLSEERFTFKDNLLKYGNFIALVAEAEESDQVAAAIEAVALPVGSSITKKYASFSVALNAYTGIAVGKERLEVNGEKTFFGVAAPVGFSFSKGFNKKGSISLLTTLIDVGALAAIRFNDDNTSELPEISFKNILAPGGYLVYGFGGDIPLSFGMGAQLGPNLRAIKDNTTVDNFDSGWRWGVFLAVDIPIANLYVR